VRSPLRLAALVTATLVGLAVAAPATALRPEREVVPLPRAHAHNDYNHSRPLLDALHNGFTSVEADVWLVDGKLLVAHDLAYVDPKLTLAKLYLDPLEKRIEANDGSVYPGWSGRFQLLIDVKSDATATYQAIDAALRTHKRILTSFVDGTVRQRAVTAVSSGGEDRARMQSQHARYAAYDGRTSDIDAGVSPAEMPLVSDSWFPLFGWTGRGPMPDDQRAKLHDIVDRAHAAGYLVRFWATPDLPSPERRAVWTELLDAGVDYLNTDDLVGLKRFFRNHAS